MERAVISADLQKGSGSVASKLRCWARSGRTVFLHLALLASPSLIGCTEVRWETGRIPDFTVLEQRLTLGQSTMDDVRAVLGQPAGDGGLMMPVIDQEPRKIWSYYYSRGSAKVQGDGVVADSRRIALFIYFNKNQYDGYQWRSKLGLVIGIARLSARVRRLVKPFGIYRRSVTVPQP